MHVPLLMTLALVVPVSLAHAADETFVPWQEASFTTVMPAPYGRLQLQLKMEPDGTLTDVALMREGGTPLHVPPVPCRRARAPKTRIIARTMITTIAMTTPSVPLPSRSGPQPASSGMVAKRAVRRALRRTDRFATTQFRAVFTRR